MSDVPLPTANLATVFIQGPMYGIFLALFSVSTFCFVRRALSSQKGLKALWRMPLFIASVSMFCTITAHFVISIIRTFQAFIYFEDGKAPELFYINLSHWTTTATQGLTIATLTAGDVVLVYRIFVVYQGNLAAILLPLMTLLASIACAIEESVRYSRFKLGDDVVTYVYSHIITSTSSLTLANNCICSALIVYRVWRTHTTTKAAVYIGGTYRRVLINIVQGAGLYVLWALLFVIMVNIHSNLTQTIWDTWAPVTGVAFMLVNVHVLLATDDSFTLSSRQRVAPSPSFGIYGKKEIALPRSELGDSTVEQTSSTSTAAANASKPCITIGPDFEA